MGASVKRVDSVRFLAAPAAPTVTPQGTPGVVTRTYKIVALDVNGGAVASATSGSDATGVTTLGLVNFERITWTPSAIAAGGYDIYRTDSIEATNGKIGHVAAGVGTFDDTGLVGDNAAVPAGNTTGVGASFDTANFEAKMIQFGGTFVATLQVQGTINGTNWVDDGAAATAVGILETSKTWSLMRIKQTAYTSGDPTVWFAGRRLT